MERALRNFSTLSGVLSLLVLIVFMLLGGPILGVVYGSGYQSAAMVLLSAGKLAAVWAGSCGAVLQFTGHQRWMLRVNLLSSPLCSRGPAGGARLRTDRGRQHDGRYHCLAERGTGVGRQEKDHVDLREPLANSLAKGFVEAMSTLWHTLGKAVAGSACRQAPLCCLRGQAVWVLGEERENME